MNIYKNQKLIDAFIIYVQQQNASLPGNEALKGITFSSDFEIRMKKLFARRRHGYYVLFGTVMRRVATIVVALLISATIVTASVEALRTPVVRFFTEVYERFTQIFVMDNTAETSDTIKFEPHIPTNIPEGYVVSSEQMLDSQYQVIYIDEYGNHIRFVQRWKGVSELFADTEDIQYTDITINGCAGISYFSKGKTFIIFTDENYTYTLSASVDREKLKDFAEFITK